MSKTKKLTENIINLCKNGKKKELQDLLLSHPDFTNQDAIVQIYFYCYNNNHLDMIEFLHECKLILTENNLSTLMNQSCANKDLNAFKIFEELAQTCSKNLPDFIVEKIFYSIDVENFQFVHYIMDNYIKNASNKNSQKTVNQALKKSAEKGSLEMVKYFIDHHADVSDENYYAFRRSVLNGHTDTAIFLIEAGADIFAAENYALRVSASKGHIDIVDYLLENGEDIKMAEHHAHPLTKSYLQKRKLKLLFNSVLKINMKKVLSKTKL